MLKKSFVVFYEGDAYEVVYCREVVHSITRYRDCREHCPEEMEWDDLDPAVQDKIHNKLIMLDGDQL